MPSMAVRRWKRAAEPLVKTPTDNLIVQLGTVTEPLNRQWYEQNTGNAITDVQKRVQHPVLMMAATLDGFVAQSGAVFEAKFMLP
jgi:hypothetical protein